MGWQDRDWAKLSDDELEALYGVQRRQAAPSSGTTLPPTTPVSRLRVQTTTTGRQRFWIGMTLFLVVAGGFAYTHRETAPASASPAASPAAEPTVLYGMRGTSTTVPSQTPGAVDTVCTEEEFDAKTQSWFCVAWTLNPRGLPVVLPAPYRGPCTHLVAATTEARWTCLGNETFVRTDSST